MYSKIIVWAAVEKYTDIYRRGLAAFVGKDVKKLKAVCTHFSDGSFKSPRKFHSSQWRGIVHESTASLIRIDQPLTWLLDDD